MNIKVELNPAFKEVNESTKRYIIMKGSAGSGKSVDTATNYILRLMKDAGRNLLCVRKSDITNRDSTFAELQGAVFRMFGENWEKYWSIKQNPLMLECKHNGNQIIFRGVNDDKQREKLKSIIDEIESMKKEEFPPKFTEQKICKKCAYHDLCFI